jgi:hypothetical protein
MNNEQRFGYASDTRSRTLINRRPDTGARCSGQGESPGDVWALLSIRTPHCDERLRTS